MVTKKMKVWIYKPKCEPKQITHLWEKVLKPKLEKIKITK